MPAADKSEECWPDGQPCTLAVPGELRHALQSVACLSGVLFLLPLGLLVSRPPSATEACGWAGESLDSRCAVALALLWFSLVASVAQLVMLSAASSARRFIRRLWWHLPALVLSTLLGGAIGMHALGLYLALFRGNCEAEWHGPHIVLIAAIVAGYLIFVVYACLMRSEAKFAASSVSPDWKLHQQASAQGKYETTRASGQSQGENPVVLSVVPAGPDSGSDGLKLFNVASSDHRISRDTSSTAAYSQISPSPESGGSSNSSSKQSDLQKPVPLGSIEGVLAEEAELEEEEEDEEVRPRKQDSKAGSASSPVINITPAYASGGSQGSSNDSREHVRPDVFSIDPLKPALSSFATAKRDGKVSLQLGAQHGKSGKAKSRRGSGESKSRRGSAEGVPRSRRGSASESKSRRGSASDFVESRRGSANAHDGWMPPAPSPRDPTEQLCGELELALVARRASLTKLQGSEDATEDNPSSRKSSLSSCENTNLNKLISAADDSPKKKKKGLEPRMSKKSKEHEGQEEAVFHEVNPVNFDCLTMPEDSDSKGSDSDTDSDCRSDETETWNTGASAKVEVPIWLLEKLQARGWEPPEEEDDSPEPATKKNVRVEATSPGSSASCPDLQESEADKGPRQIKSPMVLSAGAISAPFWKIPMPTRKNTMMIHAEKGKKGMEDEEDEDEEDDEEEDEDKDSDAYEVSNDPEGVFRMSLVHPDGAAEDLVSVNRSVLESVGGGRDHSSMGDFSQNGGILKNNPSMKAPKRKISFMDQELGQSFEKYSEEKKTALAGIDEGGPMDPLQSFKIMNPTSWKKPTRSRANSIAHPPGQDSSGSKEETGNSGGDSSLAVPEHGRRSRRPSLLAVFSDDNAKSPGLYALPKENEAKQQQTTSELVEIRRGSLVMSSSMLGDILKSKDLVGSDRLDDIDEGMAQSEAEVILPFFSQAQAHIRNCQCQTDPETGNVIHTCMTPSATQTTNSVFQSYICSEWGTRRNSADKAKSRRNSSGSSDSDLDDEDDDIVDGDIVVPPPPKPEQQRPPSRKRIRNASVLAKLNSVAPLPATKTEVEEEPAQENELAISFKNIQSVEDSCLSDSSPETPEKKRSAPKQSGEARVETELTHKFELLEPYIMAGMLKDSDYREHLLVVDVRGRDWVGGHIPSSINLRTSEVVAHPEALLTQCRQNKISHLVFTCMYSVLRARKCAVAVEKAQGDYLKVEKNSPRIRLSLLAGGMHAWVNHFMKSQTDNPPRCYLDGFDPEMWSDGGPSQGGLVHVMDALWSSGGQKALSDALTQELEQLVLMRRNSQELSRRQSNCSDRHTAEAPAENRIVDEPAEQVTREQQMSPDIVS